MTMIHSSKTAYVAIADHRDASGAFKAGDIVIVDEPALLPVLFAEGSLDPDVVVDASLFTPGAGDVDAVAPAAAPKAKGARPRKSAAAGRNRMVKASAVRGGPLPAVSLDPDAADPDAVEMDDGLDDGEVG